MPSFVFQPQGEDVIVDPHYDPDVLQYGSLTLYLPDAYKDSQSHQGRVVAAGPKSVYPVGSYLLYKPWNQTPFQHNGREYLHVRLANIVAEVRGKDLFPPVHQVLVIPAGEAEGPVKTSSIYTINRVFDSPARFEGTVIRTGESVRELKAGDRILYQPEKDTEVGWIDSVYYILQENHVLARLEPA